LNGQVKRRLTCQIPSRQISPFVKQKFDQWKVSTSNGVVQRRVTCNIGYLLAASRLSLPAAFIHLPCPAKHGQCGEDFRQAFFRWNDGLGVAFS
jgi:hypothetical protein